MVDTLNLLDADLRSVWVQTVDLAMSLAVSVTEHFHVLEIVEL